MFVPVIYGCFGKPPPNNGFKEPFYYANGSVVQEFGRRAVGVALLCYIVSGCSIEMIYWREGPLPKWLLYSRGLCMG